MLWRLILYLQGCWDVWTDEASFVSAKWVIKHRYDREGDQR
jgi:hypothetical protein